MKIGKHTLKNNLILAPMAGFSMPAMRRLAAECGAGLTVSEMISVKGLLYGNAKTNELLKTSDCETTKCVQLFGREPQDFYDCALLPQLAKFDIIDINMGCPVRKIISEGAGSALMNDFERAADIVKAVKSAGRTVTVKTRLPENGEPAAFALNLQNAGADMITIHARTAVQMYKGTADYSVFSQIKRALNVPVTLSGDIIDIQSYKKAKESGADLYMIGRGAVASPAIFSDILLFEQDDFEQKSEFDQKNSSKKSGQGSTLSGKYKLVIKLLDYMQDDIGENQAVKAFRKFLPYVLKGEKCIREQKHSLNFIQEMDVLKAVLCDIFQQ